MSGALQRISNTANYIHENSNTVSEEFNQFSPQQNPFLRDQNIISSSQQQKFKVNGLQMSGGQKERDSITSIKSNHGMQISGSHQTNILKTVAGNIMDHKPNIQMFENAQSSQISRYNPIEDNREGYNDKGSVMSNLMGQGIIGQHQNQINGGSLVQGTKSTTALNSVGNLITRDQQLNPNQSTTNSQIMLLRNSIGQNSNINQNLGGLTTTGGLFQQQNPISNRVVSGTQNINTSASNMGNNQYFKNAKAHQNDRVSTHQTYDKKNIFSQTGGNTLINQNGTQSNQTGLLPRISNLRNEVTILFKNTNGSQNNQVPQQLFTNTQGNNMGASKTNNTAGGRMNSKPMSSPRAVNQNLNNFNGQQSILADNTYTGTKNLMDRLLQHPQQQHSLDFNHNQKKLLQSNQENNIMILKDDYSKSLIEHSESLNGKTRKRLRSNHQQKHANPGNTTEKDEPPFYTQHDVDESFNSDSNQKQVQLYYSEKVGGIQESQIVYDYHIKHGMIKDDMSIGGFNKQTFSNDDQHQLALTPQIMSSQSNKRRNNVSKQQENILSQQQQMFISQQQKQQFFARRTGSNKEQAGPFQYPNQFQYKTQMGQIQTSFDQNTHLNNLSPLNAHLQNNQNENSPMLQNLNSAEYQRMNSYTYKNQMQHYHQMRDQKSDENSPDKLLESDLSKSKTQQPNAQQEVQPKIPVICGFHKRVLLLTSQVGVTGPNQNSQNAMAQTRRIRNKNPNCNHNNNFTFYQPSYNNVKYDDSYKKKEEVLRKVFFKECAKEEEKRTTNSAQNPTNPNQSGQVTKPSHQQNKVSMNDPIAHLKIIENAICQSLFTDYENSKNSNNSGIYASQSTRGPTLMTELGLEQAIVAHKSFLLALIQAGKIINENMFKVLHEFKQSARDFDNECIYCKYSQYALRESAKVGTTSSFVKSTGDSETLMITDGTTQPQDPRIDNLVRMFQSQLFKRSFINTSLMIIQRKMNEKLLAKQKSGAPDKNDKKKSLPTGGSKDQQQKKGSNTNTNPQNAVTVPQSSLDQLSNQMQKLAKNLSNPKDKEKFLELKEKYYKEFLLKINQSNGISINFPKTSFVPYKYYVGKGNNSLLVRNCLKQRFWWSMGDFEEWHEYNFIWTQWKSNKIISVIKSNQDVIQAQKDEGTRSGLTSGGTTAVGTSDSLLSTQMTVTDRDSNSSVETLLATPTRRKRASTLPQNASQITQNNLAANKKGANSSISNSASKNIKLQNVNAAAAANNEEKEPKQQTSHSIITYGHMENNFHLSNKKAIYYNMKIYYESIGQDWWKVLPLTFHVKEGPNDKEFLKFQEIFKGNDNGQYGNLDKLGKTIWIVKPGENTNRGCGIQVCREIQQIREIVSNTNVNGQKRSYIIQKYIEKPLLYKNRKFDIRCYALITTVNGNMQGYWYNEGYLRTSSKDFNLKNVTNRLIHLTNDAVQKKSDDYGKFESGNKLSYSDFQKYLDSIEVKCNIVKEIVPQLKKIATDTIKAVSRKLDPHRRHNTFEIFGYDFMIDEDLRPWLIEVNTNPCLELSAPYLARLIPTMIENAVKIAVDPLFPPPPWPNAKKHMIPDCTDNKFELVFNESTDAQELKNLPIDDTMNGIIEEEEMEDEGSDGEEEDLS